MYNYKIINGWNVKTSGYTPNIWAIICQWFFSIHDSVDPSWNFWSNKMFCENLNELFVFIPRNLFSCLFKEIIDNEHWNSCILLGVPKVTTKRDNFCHDSNVISQTFHLNDEYQFRTKFCFYMSKFLFFLKNNFAWHAWLMRKLDHGWYYTKLGKKLTAFIPVILSRKLELKNFCSFNRYLA